MVVKTQSRSYETILFTYFSYLLLGLDTYKSRQKCLDKSAWIKASRLI